MRANFVVAGALALGVCAGAQTIPLNWVGAGGGYNPGG